MSITGRKRDRGLSERPYFARSHHAINNNPIRGVVCDANDNGIVGRSAGDIRSERPRTPNQHAQTDCTKKSQQ